ncbi:hypothetical protein MC7420_70 [Coleofasciculus chthonoplastes PCC 7420]|uniref:Uncharacterized protein n=1 Tax=Coleofasciculus chthonoplastes PCC 7420 TaxID=118168 RepID=B4W2X1_9CYAN|nr:hypothetical protein MC7420_70 [Coleofasciculus chthonoplastes PCC 7420]
MVKGFQLILFLHFIADVSSSAIADLYSIEINSPCFDL